MPQIFHPSFNVISRVSIFGALFIIAGIVWLMAAFARSDYATDRGVIKTQPVQFSHRHHVGDIGIDCRYCHKSVEESSSAGMPSSSLCMNCHNELFTESEMLKPVRDSYRTKQPLEWSRVHDMPDFAYFNHSIHVKKGVSCHSCHGDVDNMPLMWRESTLHMEWCLDCHRKPEENIRPREFIFQMDSMDELVETEEFRDFLKDSYGEEDAAAYLSDPHRLGNRLVNEYDIENNTHCSTCHR